MVSQIFNTFTGFTNRGAKDTQPKPTTIATLPESVLQILKDVNCTPPDALATLQKNVVHFTAQSKLTYNNILLLGAGMVLTGIVIIVTSIAAAIFGHFFLSVSLGILGMVTIGKLLSSLPATEFIEELGKTIKTDVDLVVEWLKQIDARKKQNDLSSEQLKAINQAKAFVTLQLINANTQLESTITQVST